MNQTVWSKVFKDQWLMIKYLPDNIKCEALTAAANYFLTGQRTEITGEGKILYDDLVHNIDEGKEAYERKATANRENGLKGGRPKKPSSNPVETQSVSSGNAFESQSKADNSEDSEDSENSENLDKLDRTVKSTPMSKKQLAGMEAYAEVCHSYRSDQKWRTPKRDEYQQHHYTEADFDENFYYDPTRDFLPETKVSDNGIDDPHCPKREESKQEIHEPYYDEERKTLMVYDEDIGEYIPH